MPENVTFPIGNVALIDKIDSETGFFKTIFEPVMGKARTFIPSLKLLMNNKLGQSVSINRILDFTPVEFQEILGFKDNISERTLYRTLDRIGERHQFILELYQKWIQEQNLVDPTQFVDFSSTYFEGTKCQLGKLGYSRDHQPGKLQITFGISVGLNNIPTMLTIQKGNVQDKTHMKSIIRLCSKILPNDSLLVFDNGGNTKANKKEIRDKEFHYLTRKAKKKGPYLKAIKIFQNGPQVKFTSNDEEYQCVKISGEDDEYQYIFFSKCRESEQMATKIKKFKKALENGSKLLKKVKKGKDLGQHIAPEGYIIVRGELQKTIDGTPNPYITGIEGFFILESSVNEEPEKILETYKNRDKAEKLIRDLKEGAEMHPIRHWSDNAVIGFVLIVFLTKVLASLTEFLCKNPVVKNLKVLKKYLMHLTLTIVYPEFGFGIRIISNYLPELKPFFGNFIKKYGTLEAPNCW
jgi:transposase